MGSGCLSATVASCVKGQQLDWRGGSVRQPHTTVCMLLSWSVCLLSLCCCCCTCCWHGLNCRRCCCHCCCLCCCWCGCAVVRSSCQLWLSTIQRVVLEGCSGIVHAIARCNVVSQAMQGLLLIGRSTMTSRTAAAMLCRVRLLCLVARAGRCEGCLGPDWCIWAGRAHVGHVLHHCSVQLHGQAGSTSKQLFVTHYTQQIEAHLVIKLPVFMIGSTLTSESSRTRTWQPTGSGAQPASHDPSRTCAIDSLQLVDCNVHWHMATQSTGMCSRSQINSRQQLSRPGGTDALQYGPLPQPVNCGLPGHLCHHGGCCPFSTAPQ